MQQIRMFSLTDETKRRKKNLIWTASWQAFAKDLVAWCVYLFYFRYMLQLHANWYIVL